LFGPSEPEKHVMELLRKVSKQIRRKLGLPQKDDLRKQQKVMARRVRFESPLWARDSQLALCGYASYNDYLAHQSSKLSRVLHRLQETAEADLAEFTRRFAGCEVLKQAKSVLCLGARLGTEVKALHELGYFAVGVDLNPGADNSFVLPGDFHHLVFADESIDAVYTNALDHAFDLSRVIGEIGRVLRPGGLFVIDLLRGYEEGFVPGEFEAFHWARADGLIDRIIAIGRFEQLSARNLGYHRRDEWLQRVLRKSTTSPTLQ
jgi:SAM-dependent methyltransferase